MQIECETCSETSATAEVHNPRPSNPSGNSQSAYRRTVGGPKRFTRTSPPGQFTIRVPQFQRTHRIHNPRTAEPHLGVTYTILHRMMWMSVARLHVYRGEPHYMECYECLLKACRDEQRYSTEWHELSIGGLWAGPSLLSVGGLYVGERHCMEC